MNETEMANLMRAIADETPMNAAALMGAYPELSARERLNAAREATSDAERQAALDEAFARACAYMVSIGRAQAEFAGAESQETARRMLAQATMDLGFAQADYAAALDYPCDTAMAAARHAVDNELAGNGAPR